MVFANKPDIAIQWNSASGRIFSRLTEAHARRVKRLSSRHCWSPLLSSQQAWPDHLAGARPCRLQAVLATSLCLGLTDLSFSVYFHFQKLE